MAMVDRAVNRPTAARAKGAALACGSVIKGYRIDSVLKAGRSSHVYLGRDQRGEVVALKEFFPEDYVERLQTGWVRAKNGFNEAHISAGITAFVREATTLSCLRSNFLVEYIDVFRENGTAYLVTRFEKGRTLEQFAKANFHAGEKMPEDCIRSLFCTLLEAVGVMHAKGFVHLDIKPSNVIMRDGGTLVLFDLGSARRYKTQSVAATTATTKIASYTPGFAAPEQYEVDFNRVGPWTDLYGIAASIYYCMGKRTPLQADARLKNDRLLPAESAFELIYSQQLLAAVDRCMSLDPRDRYQAAGALQELLRAQTVY